MLITFEGLDASGKSTQARILGDRLEAAGEEIVFIREPGGTGAGEHIRTVLLDVGNRIDPVAETLLFSAARAQVVREIIRPALQRGATVVCDRYVDSTTAYQGYGRGVDLESIRMINRIATDGLIPDLTYFIDVSVETIEKRQRIAGKIADRMEQEGRAFFTRVRDGFLELAKIEPRFRVIDGEQDEQNIAYEIWNCVSVLLPTEAGSMRDSGRITHREE